VVKTLIDVEMAGQKKSPAWSMKSVISNSHHGHYWTHTTH